MADVLSQTEIDALLSAISTGEMNIDDAKTMEEEKKVKTYDFKRPDKISKDQMRTLQMIHETFARLNTTMLSGQLRTAVQIQVISVDQLTYEEFIRSIPEFTILSIFELGSLDGNAILELNPGIVYTVIDRLFGGPGETVDMSRELTDIELTVIERVLMKLLGNLKDSWANIMDVSPRIEQIESNPQFVQIVGPNEMVVLITFEVKIGNTEGMMNMCLPYMLIEPIVSKLSAQYWFSSVRKESNNENFEALKSRVNKVKVPVVARLGETEISLQELMGLKVGDVLGINKTIKQALDVYVGSKIKFKGMPGMVGKKMAVSVKEVIEEGSD